MTAVGREYALGRGSESGRRQSTKAFRLPSALFGWRLLADFYCRNTAFCRTAAGFDASHPATPPDFSLFGNFQSVIDFYTQVAHR
jgi:hypothetical protein